MSAPKRRTRPPGPGSARVAVRHARAVRALFALLVLGIVAVAAPARAHAPGLSRGEYRVTGDGLAVELVFARAEMSAVVDALDTNADGSIDAREVDAARADLERWTLANVRVSSGNSPCIGATSGAELTEQDGLVVRASYRCPSLAPRLSVDLGFLKELSHGHRHAARILSGAGTRDELCFLGGLSALEIPASESTGPASAQIERSASSLGFVRMGIEHILTGYDHIVFLFALLLVGGKLRSLFWVVTAFTLAHSLTFGLTALGVVSPPSYLVEPAIALSVAYVGAENLFAKNADTRWRISFPFGLVHGFGFASALSDMHIPRDQLPLSLLTFNLGVELGQLALLAIFVPVLVHLRRVQWFARRGVLALSTAVVALGLVWFVARVHALS